MADWYDGEPACTISEAFAKATRMPAKPKKATWDNNTPVVAVKGYPKNLDWGIYEIKTMQDRIMHTHTCSGHCFVWNAPNQLHDDGFRLYTLRSADGWGRVSILAHRLDSLIAGTGSRMYCGNWRDLVSTWGAKEVNGEAIVLLDYDCMYTWGEDTVTQADINKMKEQVLAWYKFMPEVVVPDPTDEEKARKIVYK